MSCSPRGCLGLRVGCWVTRGIQERASTEERGGGIGVHKFGGCDCSPPRSLIDLLEYRSVVCLDLRLVWPGLGETRSRGGRRRSRGRKENIFVFIFFHYGLLCLLAPSRLPACLPWLLILLSFGVHFRLLLMYHAFVSLSLRV